MLRLIFKNLLIETEENRKLLTLLILYISYMFAMSRITRGMYIYNYFIPLIFTFGMASYWVPKIFNSFQFKIKNKTFISQVVFSMAIIGTWYYYSPLTYFSPLSCQEFKNRALFDGWDMRGVNCKFGNNLYRVDEALKESSSSNNSK
jgi:dolichyl-phosphate-mannose--protein O-mannosyl transferase